MTVESNQAIGSRYRAAILKAFAEQEEWTARALSEHTGVHVKTTHYIITEMECEGRWTLVDKHWMNVWRLPNQDKSVMALMRAWRPAASLVGAAKGARA